MSVNTSHAVFFVSIKLQKDMIDQHCEYNEGWKGERDERETHSDALDISINALIIHEFQG
jgi:hypothetical protein